MFKSSAALGAAAAAFWIAGAMGAGAHEAPCRACGPIPPTTHYRVVHPQIYRTHVRDVSVYRHVRKIHRIINVTEVQPVVHLHVVTRVHHHTVVHVRDQYHNVVEHLEPIRLVTHSTQHLYDCGCSP